MKTPRLLPHASLLLLSIVLSSCCGHCLPPLPPPPHEVIGNWYRNNHGQCNEQQSYYGRGDGYSRRGYGYGGGYSRQDYGDECSW